MAVGKGIFIKINGRFGTEIGRGGPLASLQLGSKPLCAKFVDLGNLKLVAVIHRFDLRLCAPVFAGCKHRQQTGQRNGRKREVFDQLR